VRDSKTGEDLTRSILTQIILERHPERMELIPVNFLHMIIQANEMVLGSLRENMRKSQAYLELMQRAVAFNPLALPGTLMNAFFSGSPAPLQRESSGPAEADAEALARRVAELEKRLEELRAAAGKRDSKALSPKNKAKTD